MKIDGRCHCGLISYEAEVDPDMLTICHCTDCQTLGGSAFRAIIAASAENFVLRSRSPKIYLKTAESGAQRAQAFCPDCGTPLYAAESKNPTTYLLRVGASSSSSSTKQYLESRRWFDRVAGSREGGRVYAVI
jgi:hypothetical protein